jgi:hypothetical protein
MFHARALTLASLLLGLGCPGDDSGSDTGITTTAADTGTPTSTSSDTTPPTTTDTPSDSSGDSDTGNASATTTGPADSSGGDSSGGTTGAAGVTWGNFAEGFFETYCWECHGAGDPLRDYTAIAGVMVEANTIRCGTASPSAPPTGCEGEPPAGQFPIGATVPTDDERAMLVEWIDAGLPE